MTGMFLDLPELSGKQVGLLKEIVPRLSRIAIFGIPGLNATQFAATETVVRALALEAEIMEVQVARLSLLCGQPFVAPPATKTRSWTSPAPPAPSRIPPLWILSHFRPLNAVLRSPADLQFAHKSN